MAALFGPSEQDLERLRSTVQSLGTTSVPGLAAALAWRERKAEKLLAHELHRPGTPLTYDPGRRVVRWAPVLVPAPALDTPAAPDTSRSGALRPPTAPAPVFTPGGVKTLCPSCHVALQSTGSGSLAVCPKCGRLTSIRNSVSGRSEPPPAPAPAAVPRPTSAGDAPPTLSDRRSQEMFAAWVTAQPIPCPKCRTPLRHRGVSEYACPSCGQMVKFPMPAAPAAPVGAPPVPST
jgi:predicted RNA-binding Zn-ribbon protein involved in translation (DUF1610 family)